MDRKAFAELPQVARAARLMYMSGVSFKGLYTVNTVGDMRACWGYRKNPVICREDRIWAAHEYLSSNPIKLMCGDYLRAIKDAVKGDFVYFDPPYHSDNKSAFTAYQARKFLAPEQQKLRDAYVELSERGVRCLFSNNDTKLIRNLFKDFEIISVTARRCFVNGSGEFSAKEVLIKNY
jgi:DNA adenine methylase